MEGQDLHPLRPAHRTTTRCSPPTSCITARRRPRNGCKGLKANLAQKPSGGDREVARDIAAGKCDIGLGNTYYWALMNDKEADRKPWADATKVILPTFQGGGTHVNLSGVVLAKHAPNKANAMKLIEWLTGEHAQQLYADMNYEYPLRAGHRGEPDHRGLRHAQGRHDPAGRRSRTRRRPRRTWSTRSGSTTEPTRRSANNRSRARRAGASTDRDAESARRCSLRHWPARLASRAAPLPGRLSARSPSRSRIARARPLANLRAHRAVGRDATSGPISSPT